MIRNEKYRFIVVDDSKADRNLMNMILEAINTVEILNMFSDEDDLIVYLENKDNPLPDYILLDMKFGKESKKGIDIAQTIQKYFNEITPCRILIYSGGFGYSDDPDDQQENINVIADALNAGAVGFIHKGNREGLKNEIENFINAFEHGAEYFFNAPILQTIVESFLKYSKLPHFFHTKKTTFEEIGLNTKIHGDILLLMAKGYSDVAIGKEMDYTIKQKDGKKTFKCTFVQNAKATMAEQLKVRNKTGAILTKAIQKGLILPYDKDLTVLPPDDKNK